MNLGRNPNLRPCPDCGKQVSKRAKMCPGCGCPKPGSSWGSLGTVLIAVMVATAVIGIIAAIAIPNFIEARKASNETYAIGALRTVYSAQQQFRILKKATNKQGKPRYALSLKELAQHDMIDKKLGRGFKNEYHFKMKVSNQGQKFEAWAYPSNQKAGIRAFYIAPNGGMTFNRYWKRGKKLPDSNDQQLQ